MNLVKMFNSHAMKFKTVLSLAVFSLVLLTSIKLFAQSSIYAKQVITANSGKFEFMPPFNDYVSLQTYNPATSAVNNFGTIFTQSAQSILISGHFAYVTAQDSVIKYNLNTLQRVAAVPDSGLNRMALYKDRLIISRQYPVTQHFLEVLDTADLSPVAEVTGISGDCGGVCVVKDTVYVAVNGGWMGTQGKLGIIDPTTWTLKTEVAFGSDAVGIWDLYVWNDFIYTVNKTPYGMPDLGSVTYYDPSTRFFTNTVIPFKVGGGAGQSGGYLYLGLAYGIGSFNMGTLKVADTVVVADPGSAIFSYILSAVIDSITGRIYSNVGDYTTAGYCMVTSLAGDSITTYATGISSDAIAIDYRQSGAGIGENAAEGSGAMICPNPVRDRLRLVFNTETAVASFIITDISGRQVRESRPNSTLQKEFSLDVSSLQSGTYFLLINTASGPVIRPFVVAHR